MAVALALPESGLLVACERDAKSLEVAKKYYARANVSNKVFPILLFWNMPKVDGRFAVVECSAHNNECRCATFEESVCI